ncbi:MAG TPA: hypothetical protein VD885_00345 [Methylophilaceae bacterium]|nr:hypothetical protein [Methylophilaceae bacterium]
MEIMNQRRIKNRLPHIAINILRSEYGRAGEFLMFYTALNWAVVRQNSAFFRLESSSCAAVA